MAFVNAIENDHLEVAARGIYHLLLKKSNLLSLLLCLDLINKCVSCCKQGFQLCHFRSRSHSIISIVYTWTTNITPLTKDHQVWSSISRHMTTVPYSSQSVLNNLTNNMSSQDQHLINSTAASTFWTAYQKSLQDLHQKQLKAATENEPPSTSAGPLDLTSSKL